MGPDSRRQRSFTASGWLDIFGQKGAGLRAFVVPLRYGLMNALIIAFTVALIFGGYWIWLAYALSGIAAAACDELFGDDRQHLGGAAAWFYEINLFATLPLLIALTVVYLHYLNKSDPVGLIHGLSLIGIDFAATPSFSRYDPRIGATLGLGYFYAMAGITVAHELTHRVTSPVSLMVGRALLGFSWSTTFATAHVYGHHRNVAIYDDPGSARRGEYSLAFSIRCNIGQQIEAFKLEAARLRRRGVHWLSWKNRALTGQLYPIAITVGVWLIAGHRGVIGVLIAALIAMISQKLVDYVQHYGLVRADGTPIEARHAWSCHRVVTSSMQYNLCRHADHHVSAAKPFWELDARPDCPIVPCGYLTAVVCSLFPPLWHRMVDPLLAEWDRRMASDEERHLIRERGWELPAPNAGTQAVGQRA
jgi:fatty acid desaturase